MINKKFYIVFLLLLVMPLLGMQCTKGVSPEVLQASRPIILNWWSPFLDSNSVKPLIEAYRAVHPNVTINFRRIRLDNYEKEILNAMAEDRGPDIISLHNDWLKEWQAKLLPMPASLTLPFQQTSGGLKKEVITTLRTMPTLGIRGIKSGFVDVVARDVILSTGGSEEVYGLPLSLDTIALYYNRDMFNLAGIPSPPRTWDEVQVLVKKLTKFDKDGKIIQSGAALGTSRNIERAADIMGLLMMQNGTTMLNEQGQAVFDRVLQGASGRQLPPGEEALTFYTDFANQAKEVYTWNEIMPDSISAFAAGRTALFFGYDYHLPLLKNMSPKLNFGIAPMPQITGNPEINFANYWVEGVSKKTKGANFAWDFVQFATSQQQVKPYLAAAKKPTALRSLVVGQSEDLEVGIFASQVLTAKSWYRGSDAAGAEAAILSMIEQVNKGEVTAKDAIRTAAQKVNQTVR